jgi:hypothetical protein
MWAGLQGSERDWWEASSGSVADRGEDEARDDDEVITTTR